MVRNGMSPHGTLLVARARHSFGGTDCKKCSMAGNNSTGSRCCSLRSCGMFLANFQTHFNTSSATFDSLESGVVPLLGNGFTICRSKEKRALHAVKNYYCFKIYQETAYRKIDILLPVANNRRMIILMNRDKSFTFLTRLSSVSRSRIVNSSSNEVRISTVKDSARKA